MRMTNVTFCRIFALVMGLMGLVWGSHAHATIFLNENFETNTTISDGWTTGSCGWGWYDSSGTYHPSTGDFNASSYPNGCNPYRTNAGIAHSGTYALQGSYLNCGQGVTGNPCGQWLNYTLPGPTEVYTRFWYNTKNFVYDPTVTKHFYFYPGTSGSASLVLVHWFGSREFAFASQSEYSTTAPCSSAPPVSCNYYPQVSVPINDNQWYCVETHVKFNSQGKSDGMIDIWVNGTQTLHYDSRQFSGGSLYDPSITTFRLIVQDGSGLMYYDDLATGDTRIGCGETQTTPPAAPTGLSVR